MIYISIGVFILACICLYATRNMTIIFTTREKKDFVRMRLAQEMWQIENFKYLEVK